MRQESLIPLPDPAWIDVLRTEAAKPKRSKQQIADELGVSRTAISLLCAGKYSAKLDKVSRKIADQVVRRYAHQVWCPYQRAAIGESVCQSHASATMSTSDPVKLRQWAACQSCALNPLKPKDEVNNAG